MSLRPKGTPRHNTNPDQIWSCWGKDAATLVDALGALWDDQQRPSQHPIIKATRLVLLDTAAAIVNGLAESKIQAYAQNNAILEQGYLHFPGSQTIPEHAWPDQRAFDSSTMERTGRGPCNVTRKACSARGAALHRPWTQSSASLHQILQAVMEGYEIGARLGEAYAVPRGEHVDGTWGTVAATTSACRLLENSHGQTQGAINAALCQMSRSLFAQVDSGAESRLLASGLSAVKGLQLAIGAKAGLHGPAGTQPTSR